MANCIFRVSTHTHIALWLLYWSVWVSRRPS